MIEEDTCEALWALEVVSGSRAAATPDEFAKLLVQSTRIIRLYELKEKLGSGWGRYVCDKSVSLLGPSAEEKLMASRKTALSALLSMPREKFDSIKESLRADVAGLRVFDFEPESRLDFFKIVDRVVRGDTRFFKLNFSSPVPVAILHSDTGKLLISLDRFYLPPEAVHEFDTEKDAYLFFSNFMTLLLHLKENSLVETESILADPFAARYIKDIYKVFSRGIKDEKKMEIGEMIRTGKVWEATSALLEHESFYAAFKHVYGVSLMSFGLGELRFTSFASEGLFRIDRNGLEKMAEAFEKNRKTTREFFIGMCYLYATIQQFFFDKRLYLSKELEPVLPDDIGWSLPIRIYADCTAGSELRGGILSSIVGIKNIRVETDDGKFLNVTKEDTDFTIMPLHHTLINAQTYSIPESEDLYRGAIYYSPEIFYLLNFLTIRKGFSEEIVDEINGFVPRKFKFVKEKEMVGIVSHMSDMVAAVPAKTSSKKVKK
ncbi:MAG: hypothetical protein QXT45_01930 [Candidatus Bilamarchaeaceae archaeon]